jgi:hypothetical protein
VEVGLIYLEVSAHLVHLRSFRIYVTVFLYKRRLHIVFEERMGHVVVSWK